MKTSIIRRIPAAVLAAMLLFGSPQSAAAEWNGQETIAAEYLSESVCGYEYSGEYKYVPNTSDHNNTALWGTCLGVAALAAVAAFFLRRKG